MSHAPIPRPPSAPFIIPPHGDPGPAPTPAEIEAAILAAREATLCARAGKRLPVGTVRVWL